MLWTQNVRARSSDEKEKQQTFLTLVAYKTLPRFKKKKGFLL